MKASASQLHGHLRQTLAPVYLVSGDEPLLVQEACDAIRKAAREREFLDRQVFHADANLDWNLVRDEVSALSLFASRRRIEIHLPKGKIGDGKGIIEDFLKQPADDILILLISPRLDPGEQRKRWLKQVEEAGVHVQIWPVDLHRFPEWLRERAAAKGLTLTPEALELLADRTEGNLLAASQELDRLQLLCPDGTVDERMVEEAVLDSARFNVFELVAEVLQGRAVHAQKILATLEQEGENPLGVLAILSRELQTLMALQHEMQHGHPTRQFFNNRRIRQPQRIRQLEQAARRLSNARLNEAMSHCARVDQAGKGRDTGLPWMALSALVGHLTAPHH